jgi:membrane protein YdbS with pleckstrin-like domain
MGDPITVTFATILPLAAIIYFIAYGFNHWWFIAGVIIWIIGSIITLSDLR